MKRVTTGVDVQVVGAARSSVAHLLFACALTLASWGCGGDSSATDAGLDASMDASVSMDAASDSGLDGAMPDASMPDDAATDAPAPEACTMEGATRVADCAMCGSRSETCTGGVWVGASECLGQGECAVGAVDEQTTAMCVSQQRLCGATCAWGAWEDVSTGGECMPGEVQVVPRAGCTNQIVERCADTCTWEPQYAEGCGPCGAPPTFAPPKPTPELLCIPTNDVLMNRTADPSSETFPVLVSYFWMMRYPVTRNIEGQCVRHGGCPHFPTRTSGVDFDTIADYVEESHAFRYQKQDTLCRWLGGRAPRLAEWVLASRGPSPRSPRYPWWNGLTGSSSNDHRGCDTVGLPADYSTCPERFATTARGLPWTRSYFGVEAMIGSSHDELVNDVFDDMLGSAYDRMLTPGLQDPTGPTAGVPGTLVGGGTSEIAGNHWREPDYNTLRSSSVQFRCIFEVTP